MVSNQTTETNTRVSVMVSDRTKQRLNSIAFSLSTPNERIDTSQVVREAIRDYIEKHCSDPDKCAPRQRGSSIDVVGDVDGIDSDGLEA